MSKIEWTGKTWNMVTGCNKISAGCRSCYAEVMHRRLRGIASQKEKYFRPFLDGAFPYEPALVEPFQVTKPTMFFSPSMSDLFHKNIPLAYIAKVWAVMFLNPHHTFQVLTKRADRLPELASDAFFKLFMSFVDQLHDAGTILREKYIPTEDIASLPLPNVWLGVSCENQETADERIPYLIDTPAAIRFLSCEPLINSIDLNKWLSPCSYYCDHSEQSYKHWAASGDSDTEDPINHAFFNVNNHRPSRSLIDWVICGGESGRNARPMHPDWARLLRDQCKVTGIPFFFKQWGEYLPLEFDAQPPFRFFSSNLQLIDGHGIDVIDWETGEAGKYSGCRFMDAVEAIHFCVEHNMPHCDFLKCGNGKKFQPMLDGKKHLEFPKPVTV